MSDVAIDLGTSNTLIYVRGAGIVLNEPSVVAVDRDSGRLVAAGVQAKRMMGRTPAGVIASQPMRDGVIADVDLVETMLRHFLASVLPRHPFRAKPRVIVGVPSGSTELERRAVRQAVLAAGARSVSLITEPMAAAIGAGLPITRPQGSMVVNVGGGTTEIGVIALSGTVADCSTRTAGNDMDDAIVSALRKQYHLMVGDATAEKLKIAIGSAMPLDEEWSVTTTGRDLVTRLPGTAEIGSKSVRDWIGEPLRAIVTAVRHALETTPAELSSDLVDAGMLLTGGGSLVRGFDALLSRETGIPVTRDPEPLTCVVRGAGLVLDQWSKYQDVLAA